MSEPTSWARTIRQYLDYAVKHGADEAALLRHMEIDGRALADPEARIPVRSEYAFFEAASAMLNDPTLGISLMDELRLDSLDAIGFLAMTSATFGEAVERMMRYLRIMSEGERLTLERHDGQAVFRFEPWGPSRPAHTHCAEAYAYYVLVAGARSCGSPIEWTDLEFRHEMQGDRDGYVRRFGRLPTFGASENRWSFPESILARPMPKADPKMAEFFESYVERIARSLPIGALEDDVKAIIARRLEERDLSLESVARTLKMSPRTLQRRLAEASCKLSSLVDDVRRERAFSLLRINLRLAEVSYLLGFSEPRAFFRAFRRWTGSTPEQWRQEDARARTAEASARTNA